MDIGPDSAVLFSSFFALRKTLKRIKTTRHLGTLSPFHVVWTNKEMKGRFERFMREVSWKDLPFLMSFSR
jgi:hypothetical protein